MRFSVAVALLGAGILTASLLWEERPPPYIEYTPETLVGHSQRIESTGQGTQLVTRCLIYEVSE